MSGPTLRDGVSPLLQLWCWGAWSPGDDVPEGCNPFEQFADDAELQQVWAAVKDDVVRWWARERPGRRPPVWWQLEAPRMKTVDLVRFGWADAYFSSTVPEPRRRLGGIGTPCHECLNEVPSFHRGIPVHWIDPWLVSYYQGTARHVMTGELLNPGRTPADFPYHAIDRHDPPRYESEGAYLARLGLLLPGEPRVEQPDEIVRLNHSAVHPGEAA